MANLIFPCQSCGVWHDASVPCRTSQQLRASVRGEADGQAHQTESAEPELELNLATLVRQADRMEDEALRRFRLLRDVGPALES
jgi:hypothetical protein